MFTPIAFVSALVLVLAGLRLGAVYNRRQAAQRRTEQEQAVAALAAGCNPFTALGRDHMLQYTRAKVELNRLLEVERQLSSRSLAWIEQGV